MAGKLFERIGDSIAKADPDDDGLDAGIDTPEEESDESPGAALLEAIDAGDAAKVDEALRKAIRLLK